MSQAQPLKFVSLLGSLRAGSFNAVVARNLGLPALEGVEVSALAEMARRRADFQNHLYL
ncbi:hypothetical protein [Chimaeribacter arupi]|uniref:hypothetical protein n=1 Tax=Chimaeribacter arupi TaxID=2060066 RepID=UPI0029463D11|nr:hypothetical protein [Chimaeribacter arupi]MDV5139852.1 hypothetical protein [Chimaeribacter arupi]